MTAVGPRVALVAALLIVAAVHPVSPQERGSPNGVVYAVTPGQGADATLKSVISSAIDLQLAKRNASAEELDTNLVNGQASGDPLKAAAEKNSQLLLLISYTTNTESLALKLRVFDVASSKQIAEAAESGRIDLSLDAVIAEAVDAALQGVSLAPAAQPVPGTEAAGTGTAQGQGTPTADATTTAAAGAGTTATPGSAAQTAATGTAAAGTGSAAAAAAAVDTGAGPGPVLPAKRKVSLVGISTGAAIFLPSGAAGTYVSMGALATLGVNVRFALGPGTLGAGIVSGVAEMQATGAVTQASILLVPIGVDARYTLNDGGFPGITVHVSGGPSIMNVTASYTGSLTKVIPYVIGGMTLDLPFFSFLGLSIDASWAAFFESSALIIMGFTPEVLLYVRF
jgi:hypothetical protein